MGSFHAIATYHERMIQLINKLDRFCHGVTREQFFANEEKQHACFMILLQLGELATQLNKNHPSYDKLPIKHMIGLRNFVAHQYHRIDIDTIRDTIEQNIPEVKQILLSQLS